MSATTQSGGGTKREEGEARIGELQGLGDREERAGEGKSGRHCLFCGPPWKEEDDLRGGSRPYKRSRGP